MLKLQSRKHFSPPFTLLLPQNLRYYGQRKMLNMKNIYLYLLCLVAGGCLCTQGLQAQPGGAANPYVAERATAQNHIKTLKNTALLVRLKTRDKSVEAYRKSGAELLAQRVEQEQFAENKLLADLFRQYFTFCPVYFFYSSDTRAVQEGVRQGIFLNETLQRDAAIILPYDNFYIAEIDALRETLPDLGYADEEEKPQDATQSGGRHADTTLQRVIVVKDSSLTQLRRPFPFYIRASFDRFLPSKVQKFNTRLINFYQSNTAGQ